MALLLSQSLFIRADATAAIGTGHIMRCLALAQEWQDQGGKVTFISHCESHTLRQRVIDEGMDFIDIEKSHPEPSDLEQTLATLSTIHPSSSNKDWLVIDGYHFDAAYQKRIKDAGYRLLWIDDYGHAGHYYADIVLNQNISADESFYTHCEPYTCLLMGTRYCMLRREFRQWQGWQREIPDTAKKILVTLGGGDPDNVTLKVVQALKQSNIKGLEAKIVVGSANPNLEVLKKEIGNQTNLKIIANAENMPELMAWADIAISAGGSTCWELAFFGLPNIIVYFAENQRPIAEKLHENGTAMSLGWFYELTQDRLLDTINDMLNSKEIRKKYSDTSKHLVDGSGTSRVIQSMFPLVDVVAK